MIASLPKSQQKAEHICKIVVDRVRLLQHLKLDSRLVIERRVEGHLLFIEFQELGVDNPWRQVDNLFAIDRLGLRASKKERAEDRLQEAYRILVAFLIGFLYHLIPPCQLTEGFQLEELQ